MGSNAGRHSLTDAPRNHNQAEPERWTGPLHHDVAGNFCNHIPREKDGKGNLAEIIRINLRMTRNVTLKSSPFNLRSFSRPARRALPIFDRSRTESLTNNVTV